MKLSIFIYSIIFLVPAVWCRCRRSVDGDGNQCSEPRDIDTITAETYSELLQQQSISIIPGRSRHTEVNNIPQQLINITKINVEGHHVNCGSEQVINDRQSSTRHHRRNQRRNRINQVAFCPFRYVKNVDPNRKPDTLFEVECACPYTTGVHGVCHTVDMYVSVLRRSGCEIGEWQYDRVWEKLAVACVAVRIPE